MLIAPFRSIRRLRLYRKNRKYLAKNIVIFLAGVAFTYFYCEYLIYYITQVQCGWPELMETPVSGLQPVYAMVLADTHLLGSSRGHWLDKWRREWQMHRAFQTAMTLHKPDVVFVLGDLFDEGQICRKKEFNDYVNRFHRLFQVPEGTELYAVIGNHDIGFHYRITNQRNERFEKQLQSPPVQLVSMRGNHFVLINSMAMEGDGCSLCQRALDEISNITDIFRCSTKSPLCVNKISVDHFSRPILMQHFPLYRESDSVCTESDAAPLPERDVKFIQGWDCLSRESTELLIESLNPRAAFGAHTHHSCQIYHSYGKHFKYEFTEYTVPSFSWRNRLDPKYYLVSVSGKEVRVSKCALPTEWALKASCIVMLALLALLLRYINTTSRPNQYLAAGAAPRPITMSEQLVANELLAFLQQKLDVMDEVSAIQICASSFSVDEICGSKEVLYKLLNKRDMPNVTAIKSIKCKKLKSKDIHRRAQTRER